MDTIKKLTERIAKSILQKIFGLFGKELSEEFWNVCVQFIGFTVVGVVNFLVNYVTYAFFLWLHCNYHVANIAAFIVSVFNSFYWNNKYVFREDENGQRSWWKTLLKTYASYAFSGLLLTEILLYVEIHIFGLPELAGPAINLFITTPINFVMNKFWAFRVENKDE